MKKFPLRHDDSLMMAGERLLVASHQVQQDNDDWLEMFVDSNGLDVSVSAEIDARLRTCLKAMTDVVIRQIVEREDGMDLLQSAIDRAVTEF